MIRYKKSVTCFVSSVAVIISVTVAFGFFYDQSVRFLGEIALCSVKTYLPLDNKEKLIIENVKDESDNNTASESLKKQKPKETVNKKTEKSDSLTKTDSDIEKLIKNAAKTASTDEKGGAITEYTFTSEGVTDSFENVRVKNTNKTKISIENKLSEKLELTVTDKEPAVLIYHTHTTETYQLIDRDFYSKDFASRSNDKGVNMIRVGKAICDELEKRGYKVIHDTTVYDKPYSGAYYRSEDAVKALLKKYPSVQITLDIHRDAIQGESGTKTKPVATINGKKAAQIMIITGCQEEGNGITDLPEWEKNLAFALNLQRNIENSFKGLTRPVFFCDRSYNMGLTPLSLLVEIGTDANTLEEAVYSGKMFAVALAQILEEYKEK